MKDLVRTVKRFQFTHRLNFVTYDPEPSAWGFLLTGKENKKTWGVYMRRNYAEEVNSSISNFFKIICIIILVLTGFLFLWKTIFGYTKLEYMGDYDLKINSANKDDSDDENIAEDFVSKFKVNTDKKYAVHFVCESKGLDFEVGGDDNYYDYYYHFSFLPTEQNLSVFKTPDGYFTAYENNCSEKKAEREYREINKPWGWYILYASGILLSAAMFAISRKAHTTAKRQNAYMRYENVLRQKALDNQEKVPDGMSPGEMSMAINRTLKRDKMMKKKSRKRY